MPELSQSISFYQQGWNDGNAGKDMDSEFMTVQVYFQGWLDGRNKLIETRNQLLQTGQSDQSSTDQKPQRCPYCGK
jgi:hypothetical protein